MKMTGLVELNAVVAVANRSSFRGAASDLGMSASALSHAISALEHRIGVRLFNRTTRSVSLSEAGEQFIARVRPALHEISGAMEAANRFRDTPKGTLRINASEGAARMFLKTALEFLRRYPEMTLDLVADGRLVARESHCRDDADDGHADHQLDQGEAVRGARGRGGTRAAHVAIMGSRQASTTAPPPLVQPRGPFILRPP